MPCLTSSGRVSYLNTIWIVMFELVAKVDDVLRQRSRATSSMGLAAALTYLVATMVLFGCVYGAVMGSFGGFAGDRAWGDQIWQVVYSASKVPALLLITSLIGLPSFFVLNTLAGLRSDFGESLRALGATQAGLAVVLASLAPLTAVWNVSSTNYSATILFNLAMFALASMGGQWLLRGYYGRLIERNPRHRWMLWIWIVIYAFIGVQMAWGLRPFVGSPDRPVQFFREGAWENAYVEAYTVIIRLFFEVVAGR